MICLRLLVLIILFMPSFIWADASTKTSSSSKVIIHKKTGYFWDIEAPIEQVWVGCSNRGPTPNTHSTMAFYILDEGVTYDFFYGRMYDVKMCLEMEKEYRRLMQGAKTVRIVGTDYWEEAGPSNQKIKELPKRFELSPKFVVINFTRLQTTNGCKAFFDLDCKLPENYWAGLKPQ
jgi:hypothetical protein